MASGGTLSCVAQEVYVFMMGDTNQGRFDGRFYRFMLAAYCLSISWQNMEVNHIKRRLHNHEYLI